MDFGNREKSKKNIAIISSCTEDWGGSEELWGKSVSLLLDMGYQVTVYKAKVNRSHREFVKLASLGVLFEDIHQDESFLTRNFARILNKFKTASAPYTFVHNPWINGLIKLLQKNKPIFTIISQGINFDGLAYGYAANMLNIPYVLIAQKAVDFYWPYKDDRILMLKVLQKAEACYFVSKHNLQLTEEQFGKRLTNAQVIFNPLKIGKLQSYPNTDKGFRLACIGRLFLLDKGQDILLRILSSSKWRERPVSVTFVGSGVDEVALKEMAELLGVVNVSFAGQVSDIDNLWKDYHGLILPSRSEGLPLSLVEAMAAGRIAIISKAGGNTELIEENVTAFSGYPFEESFEEAMERAWNRREDWEGMGKEASKQIAELVPGSPERDFVNRLLEFIN